MEPEQVELITYGLNSFPLLREWGIPDSYSLGTAYWASRAQAVVACALRLCLACVCGWLRPPPFGDGVPGQAARLALPASCDDGR